MLVRAISGDASIAVRTLVATRLVTEATQRHGTSPTAGAALGRALMGALLLASDGKQGETVQLQFRGAGPLRAITANADAAGHARGYVADPGVHLPLRTGKLDVGAAIGVGLLSVLRFRPDGTEPYRGIVPLVSGEIAEDIAHYLRDSEQKPCAVALGVFVSARNEIEAAGGFLLHALPGAADDVLARVERNVTALPPASRLVRSGVDARQMAERLLAGLGTRWLDQIEPRFHCGCTRERVLRAATLLGRAELRDVIRCGEPLEVRCEFCAARWTLSIDDVGALALDS